MTDRKRIYAIHILGQAVYIYRKTRFQRVCRRIYATPRSVALAAAMQTAGYPVQPFVEGDWAVGELPYRLVYRETGVKFEIPGRFESLRAFDALSPLHV